MPPPALSRRAALTGVVAGLAASGCELEAGVPAPAPASPDAATGSSTPPPEDPDAALVEGVRDEIGAALALVTAAARRPALREEMAAWRRLHRLHLEEVPGESAPGPSEPVTGSAAGLRRRVVRQESRLQRTLADAAVTAESGPLAALLASMSAAVAQRLALTGGAL